MIISNSFVFASILSGAVMANLAAVEPALNKNANEIVKHKPSPPEFNGKKNGYNRQEAGDVEGEDDLKVNHGWSKFFFKGGKGAIAGTNYVFKTKGAATLKVTDAYCTGDSFLVYDNGRLILETPYVESDDCTTFEKQANKAVSNKKFSSGSIALESGHHNITIQLAQNPFGKGAGFIRLDAVVAKCPNSLNGLTVINTPVPFSQARNVCKSVGMQLANIDAYNFVDATNLAFQCSGAFSQTWIQSWWENQYDGACLALHTGSSAPGGAITPAENCKEALPVLCQVVLLENGQVAPQNQNNHNNYYSESDWNNKPWNGGNNRSSSSSVSQVEVVYDQDGNVLPIQDEVGLEELDTSSIVVPNYNNECYNAYPVKPINWKDYSSTVEWHGPYKPKPCRKQHCKPHRHGRKSSKSSSSSSSSSRSHSHRHHKPILPPTLSSSSWVWKMKNAKVAEAAPHKNPLFVNRAKPVRFQNNAAAGTINIKPYGRPFGKPIDAQAGAAAQVQAQDFINAKQPLVKNPFKKPIQN